MVCLVFSVRRSSLVEHGIPREDALRVLEGAGKRDACAVAELLQYLLPLTAETTLTGSKRNEPTTTPVPLSNRTVDQNLSSAAGESMMRPDSQAVKQPTPAPPPTAAGSQVQTVSTLAAKTQPNPANERTKGSALYRLNNPPGRPTNTKETGRYFIVENNKRISLAEWGNGRLRR
jgi:hypothetical protein